MNHESNNEHWANGLCDILYILVYKLKILEAFLFLNCRIQELQYLPCDFWGYDLPCRFIIRVIIVSTHCSWIYFSLDLEKIDMNSPKSWANYISNKSHRLKSGVTANSLE